MAGLIGLTASDMEIQDALGAVRWGYEGEWVPHPVVRLTTSLPIAVNAPEGRAIVRARWGFPLARGRPIGNARDDKLRESRMWSSMLGQSPCLVAATGVYEQVRDAEGEKRDYWFRRRDGRPIVMPGLASVREIERKEVLCCAIVTTEPNDFFAQYHNRQVCELEDHNVGRWMEERDPNTLLSLLRPPRNEEWEAVPVEGVFAKGIINEEDVKVVGEPEVWGSEPGSGRAEGGARQTTLGG